MRGKSQTKRIKVTMAALITVLFTMCFLSMAFADAFNRTDGSAVLTGINDTGMVKMGQIDRSRSNFSPKLTVTYHPNGGNGQTKEFSVEANSEYTIEKQGYTRSFYVLDCWNTRADGLGINYYNGQTIKITENITLYAIWCPLI